MTAASTRPGPPGSALPSAVSTRPGPPPSALPSPGPDAAGRARELLDGRSIVALTGAGLSTDSGIPDYRGPDSPPRRPMTYSEFVSGEPAQRRYWARSHVGWARMRRAAPNPGHRALAALGCGLITQNVDGLHTAAGHAHVVDLHGRIDEVVCLDCRQIGGRDDLQRRLTELNPDFTESVSAEIESAPDGDAALEATDGFRIAACRMCGGVLKPHVVFFGENVPRERVARCYAMVEELEPDTGALLVAGSSLAVMSGLRFVKHAAKRDVPVVIVNRGPTRGDDLATVLVDIGCSEFLAALATP